MRHPLHSICPYFAMFPEGFVAEQLYAYTRPDDVVLDPFCGRGTTILESLLNNRQGLGTDINPVAACIAGAKANVPALKSVLVRIAKLAKEFEKQAFRELPSTKFFQHCFHRDTYAEVAFLRDALAWRRSSTDRFIAAVMLGILHGESHRSGMCLSNRMPRTISTKPEYSVRWWQERGLQAPRRETFEVLSQAVRFRFSQPPPDQRGRVVLSDARRCGQVLKKHAGSVALIVTSPPYIDTTDYAEDQWLRLWFLGGEPKPMLRLHKDDRHTMAENYWSFLEEAWRGCAPLLRDTAHVVVRIGGSKLSKSELLHGLHGSLVRGLGGRTVQALNQGNSSQITKRQTNSFRPGTSPDRLEHDFTFLVTRLDKTERNS
jgi:hypothetical protein